MPRIGHTDLQHMDGVPPQMDDVDKQAVSIYGEAVAPGDVAIECSPVGRIFAALGTRAAGADGVADAQLFVIDDTDGPSNQLAVAPFLFNETTWDRPRNNVAGVLLASAARTASTASPDQLNYNNKGVIFTVDITAITATPSISPALQFIDPASGAYENIFTMAALTAVGIHTYILYPAVAAAADAVVAIRGYPLGRDWRLYFTHADADSITYSVGFSYIE